MNSNIKSVKSAVWREFSRMNFTLLEIFLFFFFFFLLTISFNLNVLKLGSNKKVNELTYHKGEATMCVFLSCHT